MDAFADFADSVSNLAAVLAPYDNPERQWLTDDGSPPSDEPAESRPVVLLDEPLPAPPAGAVSVNVAPPKPFDLGAAYGAISRVDLSACRGQGLAPGYGRVTLTFQSDGSPASAQVVLPSGSPDAVQSCAESAFRELRVTPFDGSAVSVRRDFYVGRASGAGSTTL